MKKSVTKKDLLYKEHLIEQYYYRKLSATEQADFIRFQREDLGFAARLKEEDIFLEGVGSVSPGLGTLSKNVKILLITSATALLILILYLYVRSGTESSPNLPVSISLPQEFDFIEEQTFDELIIDSNSTSPNLNSLPITDAEDLTQDNDAVRESDDANIPLAPAKASAPKTPQKKSPQEPLVTPTTEETVIDSTTLKETLDTVTNNLSSGGEQGLEQRGSDKGSVEEPVSAPLIRSAAPRIKESSISSRWKQVLRTAKMRPNRLNKFYEDRQREIDTQLNKYNSTGIKPAQ